jgi:hypothetical protein|tara:strand:- start:2468 stop:3235 length:768 start_codon:yes stop_codon:yes gene_type:complete
MKENQTPQKESLLLNLGINLILPILFLRKGTDWFGDPIGKQLEAAPDSTAVGSIMLLIAVSFPVGYGLWDLAKNKKWNLFSILGAFSALLTGGIGLVPGATVQMFAIKEAAIPTILGILTVITLKTKRPLVHLFLLNPQLIKVDLINEKLRLNHAENDFAKLMSKCTWLIALTFIMSAALNYFLSRWIVVTEPALDKIAYNDEVGRMMGWSFPIISIPCMIVSAYAFWILIKGIKNLTGLSLEDAMVQSPPPKKK